MNKPKYFAIYNDPSHGSHDAEYVMGVGSLPDARGTLQAFYGGGVWSDEYRRNKDGFYVPWNIANYTLTPGTSREDYLDLHCVSNGETPGTYLMGDLAYRLTWGERGGIVVEKG